MEREVRKRDPAEMVNNVEVEEERSMRSTELEMPWLAR
jgi:hypothetical protein